MLAENALSVGGAGCCLHPASSHACSGHFRCQLCSRTPAAQPAVSPEVSTKAYYPVFLLSGFTSFDGKEGW